MPRRDRERQPAGPALAPDADWINGVLGRRPRGVALVSGDLSRDNRAALSTRDIPFSIVDSAGDPAPGVPSIGSANWAGGLAATRHLIELEHTRIAVISGPSTMTCSRARVDDYRSALDAAGIPFDPELGRAGDLHSETGYLEGGNLVRTDEPPAAIFVGSDLGAMGVYRAANELDLAVPDDV